MGYPVVPLRDVIVYPGIVIPLFVGRQHSIDAIEKAMKNNMRIVLVTQKDANTENPKAEDIFSTGVLADIIQVLKLPDGTIKLLVEGHKRIHISSFVDNSIYTCETDDFIEQNDLTDREIKYYQEVLKKQFTQYIKLQHSSATAKDILNTTKNVDNLTLLIDLISSNLLIGLDERIEVFETLSLESRATKLLFHIENQLETITLEQKIRDKVKSQMDKNQKEYYLNEKSKVIQKELEDLDSSYSEYNHLEKQIIKAKMPKSIHEKCLNELEKLKKMSSMSSESGVIRNYLETMVSFPWKKKSKSSLNLSKSKDVLEASHYGLEKVKARILEYLAVQKRTGKGQGSILCLVGPPGVGKTSIAASIAQATKRDYVRMSLGGVRDEAEIRGHRRTYIGAMPGKIVQNLIKAKSSTPLFLLDEIDKMGMDHRGDPASAMLEVLDPEQNQAFNDHYMDVDIDLSNVMFIATANSLNIPKPLLDRMEIIHLSGYTESEKRHIAKDYLIEKNFKKHQLIECELKITDKALDLMIEGYTREAGTRQLNQVIAKLCRKVVTEIELNKENKLSISKNNLQDFLGVPTYQRENLNLKDNIGVMNGLAWTSVGGELLNIEVVVLPGKGKISVTGKLGEVMKESVNAAMTVAKLQIGKMNLPLTFFEKHDFHIHLPEGATPKDGPSAGGALAVAVLSSVLGQAIKHDIAMTGELTLQGNIIAIGGLKEKLYAAVREKIKTVYIPQSNVKDLEDIPKDITQSLAIKPVSNVLEVFNDIFLIDDEKHNIFENQSFSINDFVSKKDSNIQKH